MAEFCFVVPVYKVPYNFLQNCIDSILNQSFKDIELILVDDGSPDDCGKICDINAEKDSRIRVIHKPNGGLSDARNAGTKAATATWITYVDGDDWVDTDFAESFFKFISDSNETSDMYFYSGYRNYAQKEIVCHPYFENGKEFVSYEEREKLQEECCMVPIRNNGESLFIGSAWAKVYNLSFLRRNNLLFTIVPYGEDSIFFMYSIEAAERISYIAKPVYHYRDTEGSMVNKFRENADKEQTIYLKEMFDFAKKNNKSAAFIDILFLRVFISMQRCISQKFFNSGNPNGLFKRYKECVLYFKTAPYADIYKHVKFRTLNKNSKFKYIMFRMHLYGLVDTSRKLYNLFYGKKNCKT